MTLTHWALGFLIACFVMVFTWAYAKKINNYSIVDAVWSFLFLIMTLFYTFVNEGYWLRKTIVLACVGIWSMRLGSFLWRRIQSHHPVEDSRYVELRKKYGDKVESEFFWFFQYQAWSVVLLTVPFALIARNPEPQISVTEWIGIGIWAISLAGEALADHQAHVFKTTPGNQKKVCDVGLWKYSRHPNYFFESCIWWGYFVFALGAKDGAYTVYCPVIMLLLLTKVTGVPLSEAQSLKSRGEAYRTYQRRTSMFIPWFPKVVIFWIAFCILGSAQAAYPTRIAKIYEVGKTSGTPLFTQTTTYDDKDGITESNTTIVDPSGKKVLTEYAKFKSAQLIDQKTDQLQTDKHYEIEVKNDRVYFREGKKESTEGLFDDFSTGPVSEAFLAVHWDDLMNGKVVICRFGINEVRETVKFEFKMLRKTKIGDKDAVEIQMKPASMIISILVDAVVVTVDAKDKRYLRTVGRTPLYRWIKGERQAVDAEILYQ